MQCLCVRAAYACVLCTCWACIVHPAPLVHNTHSSGAAHSTHQRAEPALNPPPRSLRALYGTDGTQNATHGSDSPDSAAREIKFFFPSLVLEPLAEPDPAKDYITKKLQPALSKALTALAREKPSAEKFEAITFLANYLLNNNPNKPRIVTPDEWDPSVEEEDDDAEFANAQLKVRLLQGGHTALRECTVGVHTTQSVVVWVYLWVNSDCNQ